MIWPLIQLDIPSLIFFFQFSVPPNRRYQPNSFFNTVWLIMNDMTLGVAFGAFLLENNQVLAELANHIIQVASPVISLNSANFFLSSPCSSIFRAMPFTGSMPGLQV